MKNPKKVHKKIPREAYFENYRSNLLEAQINLVEAETLFASLEKEDEYTSILPGKLYYKTVKEGRGSAELVHTASLDYSVFSPDGQCLNFQHDQEVELKNTIPGFAHGISEMKVGETREILIHPSLAYGFEADVEKCISLRVIATLKTVDEVANSPLPPPQEIDLAFVMDKEVLERRTTNYKHALFEKGARIATHLQQSEDVDLSEVVEYLTTISQNTRPFSPTTEEEQKLINRVHWNIYYGAKTKNRSLL